MEDISALPKEATVLGEVCWSGMGTTIKWNLLHQGGRGHQILGGPNRYSIHLLCRRANQWPLIREKHVFRPFQKLPCLCPRLQSGFSELTRCPSRALNSPWALLPELQRKKANVRCAAMGSEVPEQRQIQLTHTLRVRCVENTLFHPYNNGAPLASPSRTPLFTHQNNKTRMETMTHGKLIIPIIAGIFCSDARRYLFLLTINVSKVSIHAYSHIDRSVNGRFCAERGGLQNQNDMKKRNI